MGPAEERPNENADNSAVVVEVFPRAPVVEAILSFRFPMLDDLQYGTPLLAAEWKDRYPKVEVAEVTSGVRRNERIYKFESPDARHVVRLTRTSFSFHRLRPYTEWRDLAAGARAAWTTVCKQYEPEYVRALSLRYLNKIPLEANADMAEYIQLCPSIPPSIDTGFSDYLLRLVLQDERVPARAEITQVVEIPPLTLAFDIDVTTDTMEFAPRSDELWAQVSRLRDYKNRLFFSSITEKCRGLFR
jgi:uncharacterized protein (TIGR04255 family)